MLDTDTADVGDIDVEVELPRPHRRPTCGTETIGTGSLGRTPDRSPRTRTSRRTATRLGSPDARHRSAHRCLTPAHQPDTAREPAQTRELNRLLVATDAPARHVDDVCPDPETPPTEATPVGQPPVVSPTTASKRLANTIRIVKGPWSLRGIEPLTSSMPCTRRTVQRVQRCPVEATHVRSYPTAEQCRNRVGKTSRVPMCARRSVDVAPRPAMSRRSGMATLLATSAGPSALPWQRVTRGPNQ
jgi:hypothetical protein